MNTENDIDQRYDDVIFENRNKTYGAYSIRREYDSNLSKGTFASFLFVACLFGAAYAAMMLKTEIKKVIVEPPFHKYLDDVVIIRDKPVQNEIKKQPLNQTSAFPTRVVTGDVVDKPVIDIQVTTISEGDINGTADVVPLGGEGLAPPIVAVIEPSKTLDIAEVMPEFEGGEKALYKFLRKTVRYPEVAKRTGEEGTVYVKFIIDVTGAVTGIEIIKGVSAALDKEALRVINLMPHWKPGKQHGMAVNVRRILPLKFEFNKE
jgi:protein TonB